MENGIQKGEMLTPNVFSNCKAFFTKVFQFLGKQFLNFKKPFLKASLLLFRWGWGMYAKERGSSIAP